MQTVILQLEIMCDKMIKNELKLLNLNYLMEIIMFASEENIMAKFKSKIKDFTLVVRVKLGSGETLNEGEFDFFTRKYMRGLLQAQKIGNNKLEYTGPSGTSLTKRLKAPINKYDFFYIVEQMIDMLGKMSMAQLPINRLNFDLNNIFINEQTKELQFIYLPIVEYQNQQVNMFNVVYEIINAAHSATEQNDGYIERFTYFMRGLQYFNPAQIEAYISNEDRRVVDVIKKHNPGQSGFMTDKPKDYYEHYDNKNVNANNYSNVNANNYNNVNDSEATGLLYDDNATTLLVDDNATTLLVEDEVHYPSVFRVSTNENIDINKPVFRLGKEKSYCDYFVNNNSAVSRSHADIITRGNEYYIMDLNSTNKTYINGVKLVPNEEKELHDGDNVRLGNEEFVFHI